jgi:hypothetical protein
MNMSNGSSDEQVSNVHLYDKAFTLMVRALALLDQAGLSDAAIRLDHAICLVPDANGHAPRSRVSALLGFEADLSA